MSEHLAHHYLRAVEPTHVRGVRQPSLTLCIMEKNSARSSLDISKYFKMTTEVAKDLVAGI